MEIVQKVNLHNEFTIICKDKRTGKKKKYKAYNTVLNQGIDKFIRGLAEFQPNENFNYNYINTYNRIMRPEYQSHNPNSYSEYDCIFGGAIQFGSGTTTPTAADTSLETYIGGKETDYYDNGIVEQGNSIYGYYTQKCTLNPSEYVGEIIREVGLASHVSNSSYLSTRALIKDAEGNQISITKTDVMEIEIYCKVYITLGEISYDNTKWVKGYNFHALPSIVAHNRTVGCRWYDSGQDDPNYIRINIGSNNNPVDASDEPVINSEDSKIVYPVADLTNKKLTLSTRFETSDAVGTKVKEIGAHFYIRRSYDTSDPISEFEPLADRYLSIFRSVLPISGVYTGHQFTTEQIGTGDATEVDFTLGVTDNDANRYIWNEIIPGSLDVFIDGVETSSFTYDDNTGTVTFSSPPAQDEVITASWQVPYIPKDASHVLDISFALQFGEGSIPS